MTVRELQGQLETLLEMGMVKEEDEVICLGSGDRVSDIFSAGFCIPPITDLAERTYLKKGTYGIGILKKGQ